MTKIKICGLTREVDIIAANECKPDFVGFVFAEKSKRFLNFSQAEKLKKLLEPQIKTVGVFVNESIENVVNLYKSGVIDIAQLHGDEDDKYAEKLKSMSVPIIRAVPVGDSIPSLPKISDWLLFDTLSAQRGGTGKSFSWDLLNDYTGKPYFLAGGISAENVKNAVKKLTPFCVDISSGVETDGFKDRGKMIEFVREVREANNEK